MADGKESNKRYSVFNSIIYTTIRFTMDILSMLNNNNTNLKEIYKELREIDELHSNFNPTSESKARMRKLISLIPISKYDRVRWIENIKVKRL